MPNKIGQLVEDLPTSFLRNNRKGHQYRIEHKVDDIPDRFELFILGEGEKKIEVKEETRVPNTTVFTFNKEDHTLGNLLSQKLHDYPYVTFSAYKVPHPLFARFELRVSTDGTKTPKEAVLICCSDIVRNLGVIQRSFTTEWLAKQIVREGEAERAARERDGGI